VDVKGLTVTVQTHVDEQWMVMMLTFDCLLLNLI